MPEKAWYEAFHVPHRDTPSLVDDAVAGVRGIIAQFQPAVFRALRDTVRAWVGSYSSPTKFQAEWKYMRLGVPLQFRLLVEQILWDMGLPWRNLVTGFNPVKHNPSR